MSRAEARRLGRLLGTRDDIEGLDSAHKLQILASLAYSGYIRFADIYVEGIQKIEAIDIEFARELGYRIKLLAIAKEGKAKLVFLGDSITAGWAGNGKEVWPKAFDKYHPANFGIGGDRTQHVLWRLQNGELDGITPKVAVLMIGTNNCDKKTDPADVAAGIKGILELIKTKQPQAKILLLSILPCGEKPNPGRDTRNAVNDLISKFAGGAVAPERRLILGVGL